MTSEPITVRLCTADDLPALTAREPAPPSLSARQQFDRQQAGDYLFAVAFGGEEPMGSCVLDCREGSLQPELRSLWVYPEHRRQGAARALTTFLEREAATRGFVEVFLKVNPDNEAAIPMYIGLDYTPTGDHVVTTLEWVDADGVGHSTEQTDAVYRKSLLTR